MPDNSLPLLRCNTPRIRQINLVVPPVIGQIILVSVFIQIPIHHDNRGRLIIVSPDMHALHTEPFFNRKELHLAEILLFLICCVIHRPLEIFFCHKVRKPYHGEPLKIFLMTVIDPGQAILPPETFQRGTT